MNSKKISFANLSFIHEKAGLRGWVETVCESACWTRTRRVIPFSTIIVFINGVPAPLGLLQENAKDC